MLNYLIEHENKTYSPDGVVTTHPNCTICHRVNDGTKYVLGYLPATKETITCCLNCASTFEREELDKSEKSVWYILSKTPDSDPRNAYPNTYPASGQCWIGNAMRVSGRYKSRRIHSPIGGRIQRINVWFSHNDKHYHGVNLGDNNIVRCKRIKHKTTYGVVN